MRKQVLHLLVQQQLYILSTDEYLGQKRRELLDKLDERYVRLQERMQEDGYPFLPDQS